VIAAVVLVLAAAAAAVPAGWVVLGILAGYVALTVAYSAWLKPIAVLDIGAVALGFVLRAVAGSVATDVSLSRWFLILISFGSLFVVAGKRYADFEMGDRGTVTRGPIAYTAPYLRFVWTMAAAVAVAAYCLWAFSTEQAVDTPGWAQLSAIPFVLGLLRYALLLESGRGGAPEELLLSDRPLQALSALWLATYLVGIYLAR
jgi:decaprenyl-phosphate phosphoribosyltransferase